MNNARTNTPISIVCCSCSNCNNILCFYDLISNIGVVTGVIMPHLGFLMGPPLEILGIGSRYPKTRVTLPQPLTQQLGPLLSSAINLIREKPKLHPHVIAIAIDTAAGIVGFLSNKCHTARAKVVSPV